MTLKICNLCWSDVMSSRFVPASLNTDSIRSQSSQFQPTFDSQVSSAQEIQIHTSESEQIRTLLERQREQILADCQAEIRKHEVQADYNRRSIQKLNVTIELQKEEICRAHQGDERRRQDQQLLHEQ